jgi:hypothetical protein
MFSALRGAQPAAQSKVEDPNVQETILTSELPPDEATKGQLRNLWAFCEECRVPPRLYSTLPAAIFEDVSGETTAAETEHLLGRLWAANPRKAKAFISGAARTIAARASMQPTRPESPEPTAPNTTAETEQLRQQLAEVTAVVREVSAHQAAEIDRKRRKRCDGCGMNRASCICTAPPAQRRIDELRARTAEGTQAPNEPARRKTARRAQQEPQESEQEEEPSEQPDEEQEEEAETDDDQQQATPQRRVRPTLSELQNPEKWEGIDPIMLQIGLRDRYVANRSGWTTDLATTLVDTALLWANDPTQTLVPQQILDLLERIAVYEATGSSEEAKKFSERIESEQAASRYKTALAKVTRKAAPKKAWTKERPTNTKSGNTKSTPTTRTGRLPKEIWEKLDEGARKIIREGRGK